MALTSLVDLIDMLVGQRPLETLGLRVRIRFERVEEIRRLTAKFKKLKSIKKRNFKTNLKLKVNLLQIFVDMIDKIDSDGSLARTVLTDESVHTVFGDDELQGLVVPSISAVVLDARAVQQLQSALYVLVEKLVRVDLFVKANHERASLDQVK